MLSEKILVRLLKDCAHGKAGSLVEVEPFEVEILEKYGIFARADKPDVKGEPGSQPQEKPQEKPGESKASRPAPEKTQQHEAQPEAGLGDKPRGPPKSEEKKAEIDPELAGYLSSRGFTRGPEGVAFTRIEALETGDIVKLQVDFSDTPKGTRYGYRLDLQSDPPEWKSDPALHDHPALLEFKRFRDDLLARREARVRAPPVTPKPAGVPAGKGAELSLLPPQEKEKESEEEAKEIERRDEAFIIRELKGDLKVLERALADYFYSFELRGRRVIGISYAGIKAIIRRMGHIEMTEIKIEEKERSWFVLVKARDKLRDIEAYGPATQPKYFPSGEENPFALTIAVSKAQRNAWRVFVDEKVLTETYRAWLEKHGETELR